MEKSIFKAVLSFVLSVNIIWCGLVMYKPGVFKLSMKEHKVHHSCWGCKAIVMGSWLWNVSWSEWRTWGYHYKYGPNYQEKHSTKP